MKIVIVFFAIFFKVIFVENKMFTEERMDAETETDEHDHPTEEPATDAQKRDKTFHDIIRLITSDENENDGEKESEEPSHEVDDKHVAGIKKPCSIVVISNIQTPRKQTLLRKYRYDAQGALIPSSVKYFIKLPQGKESAPILVPLNDKSFSHMGGFVRIYKEVPPIPQAMT